MENRSSVYISEMGRELVILVLTAVATLSVPPLFADQKSDWIKAYEAYKAPEKIGGLARNTKDGIEIRFPGAPRIFRNDTANSESRSVYRFIRRIKSIDAYVIAQYAGERVSYLLVRKSGTDTLPNFPVFNSSQKYMFVYGNDELENLDLGDASLYLVRKKGVVKVNSFRDSLGTPWFVKWSAPYEMTVIGQKGGADKKPDTSVVDVCVFDRGN